MTKKHFIDAAAIVRNIVEGNWTEETPSWANRDTIANIDYLYAEPMDTAYLRAVQTAEAFVMLFTQHNPRFDTNRFLIACGLMSKPVKVSKGKA